MSYLHKGKILRNGLVEPGSIITDQEELSLLPRDDCLHIVDLQKGEFEYDRIWDRKDLLEKLNPVARILIRTLFAKPAYHGILARVRLQVNENPLQGYGNFESMVFRRK